MQKADSTGNIQMINQTANQFPLLLKTMGFCFFAPGLIAAAGNIMIILAIFRQNSSIQATKCAKLLGSLAIFDFISALHFVQTGLGMILGWSWLIQMYCFLSQIPYVFSLHASSFLILMVAIDRWLFLQFSSSYFQINQRVYIGTCVSLSVLFGLSNLIFGAIFASWDVVVPACALPTALNGPAELYWVQTSFAINILVVLTYCASYIRVRVAGLSLFRSVRHANREKHFLNSMLIITVVYCLSYMIPFAVLVILNSADVGPSVVANGSFFVGPVAAVNFACNFFVYFIRSVEYRNEFLKLLGLHNYVVMWTPSPSGIEFSHSMRRDVSTAQASTQDGEIVSCPLNVIVSHDEEEPSTCLSVKQEVLTERLGD